MSTRELWVARRHGAAFSVPVRSGILVVVAVVVTAAAALVAALVVGGGRPAPSPVGLPAAGQWVGWTLPGLELAVLGAGLLAVGPALVAGLLVTPGEGGVLSGPARAALRSAARWGAGAVVLSVAAAALGALDTAGAPLGALLPGGTPVDLTTGASAARLVAAAVAATCAVVAVRAVTTTGARVALVLSVGALLPPVLAGHAASVSDVEVAATGIVVHVGAAALWVGGLVGLLVHLRRHRDLLGTAVGRFSTLALGCFVALALSGAWTALTRLDPSWASWSSGYGVLVGAKMVALVALGACGHAHRRRTLRRLDGGTVRPFVRLATAELVLMGAASGLAVALSRTPPPAPTLVPQHGSGHASLPAAVEPISWLSLATAVRPNAVALLAIAGAWLAYRAGIRRFEATVGTWPSSRTRAADAAAVLALVALCSGVATYAPAMLSMQVVQLLVMVLAVPALVARSAPRQLTSRPGPGGLSADLVAGGVAVGVLVVLVYRTPLIEWSQQSHWTHLLVLLAGSVAGFSYFDALRGAGTAGAPGALDRVGILVPVVCLAALALQLLLGERLLAAEWFLELRWSWVDPVMDQRRAGLAAAAATVVLGAAVLPALVRRR
ncbi:MAG TPA: CopD family protein [Nocardioides sp.]|nr:CopD family protein [Nocardioides sp.]